MWLLGFLETSEFRSAVIPLWSYILFSSLFSTYGYSVHVAEISCKSTIPSGPGRYLTSTGVLLSTIPLIPTDTVSGLAHTLKAAIPPTTQHPWFHSPSPNPSAQPPIKLLAPHRHLQRIERILHHIVGIELIDLPHNSIAIRLMRLRKQQKLDTRRRLKARQPEIRAFEHLEAGELGARNIGGYWGRCQRPSDCVDAVECACEDEVVV